MKTLIETDDFMLLSTRLSYLAHFARKFYGGLVGFGARVADEDFGGLVHGAAVAGFGDEEVGEGAGPGVVIEVGCVN